MYFRITVNSWTEVLLLFDIMTEKFSDWAFRGQSNENWNLSTKFEREASRYQCDSYWFRNREKIILQDFQRKAHQYVKNLPAPDSTIDWLSLVQHYGGPTRLLDFTYSYYVAAFFAVETATADAAIWAININKLIWQISKINDYDLYMKDKTYQGAIGTMTHWAETIIENRASKDIVYVIDPFRQHERISIQQGFFLFPGNLEKPFEQNLSSSFEFKYANFSKENAVNANYSELNKTEVGGASVIKIILPYKIHSKVLSELHKMNVTAATLFSGLDGFARSLSFYFGHLNFLLNRDTLEKS